MRRRLRLLVPLSLVLFAATACYARPDRERVARPAPDPAGVAGSYCYWSPERSRLGADEITESRYWQEQEAKRPGTIRSLLTGWSPACRSAKSPTARASRCA